MNPLIQSKNTTILPVLIAVTLGCFALSPQARAVCQEGCLTNSNTALGEDALLNNLFGFDNTATGARALESNSNGYENTASGFGALSHNNIGIENTATGFRALASNTTGSQNTANGSLALFNATGIRNTAVGAHALFGNATGEGNTATGYEALHVNKTGSNNTAYGLFALFQNTGSSNTAVGASAGINLTTGDNNIDIGNVGAGAESNTIRIGNETHTNTFIAGISGVTVAGGVGVIIDANGQLGTIVSSARFKEGIKPMNKASEAIFSLQPVTFRYKKALDPLSHPQFGLVAEQVAKVNPDLVARDGEGKPYTVRYEAVNAMLLNEFLKEHRKVEALEATVAQLQAAFKAQAAQIQKVSDRLGAQVPGPRVVAND